MDVRVWRLDLDTGLTDSAALKGAWRVLSDDERARANRLTLRTHQARFILARAALRRILAEAIGADPAGLRFRYGPSGKPNLESERLSFSVAHAGGRALIALSPKCEIGVDLEPYREIHDRHVLVGAVFGPEERKEFARLGCGSRAFLTAWTRKEAIVKATGAGLVNMQAVSVTLTTPARLRNIDGRWGSIDEWTLADISDAAFSAAIAMRSTGLTIGTANYPLSLL